MLEVKIFTLYPDLFPGPLDMGIYKKAKENKIWDLKVINIRDYSTDGHGSVDDTPFGGGSGMLLRPDVVASALDKNVKPGEKIIIFLQKEKNLIRTKQSQLVNLIRLIFYVVISKELIKGY